VFGQHHVLKQGVNSIEENKREHALLAQCTENVAQKISEPRNQTGWFTHKFRIQSMVPSENVDSIWC
jgi:hypothetical protein